MFARRQWERIAADETKRLRFALSRARADAAKQPRKGAKESATSPRTEEELAGRKPATMAATLAALTSQCGGPLDPL